jgi:hypothetical protein
VYILLLLLLLSLLLLLPLGLKFLMALSVNQTVLPGILGRLINNEIEWIWEEEVVACLRLYPGICLEGQRKTRKIC